MTDPTPKNTESEAVIQPAADEAATPAVHTWKTILLGLWAVGLLVSLCAVLLATFLQSRPVDLRDRSRQLADDLERLLVLNQVPPLDVQREAEEPQHDETTRWIRFTYHVHLPDTLSLAGVERVIRHNMARRNIKVLADRGTAPDAILLHLTSEDREIVQVTLSGKVEKTDLIEATRRIAQETVELLSECEPTVKVLERFDPERKENEKAVWEFTALNVRLATPESIAYCVQQLNKVSEEGAIAVKADEGNPGGSGKTVSVTYHGLECVRLTASAPPLVPVPVAVANVPSPSPMPDYDMNVATSLTDAETLPLESEHLNGDAHEPAPPTRRHRRTDTLQVAIIVDDGGYGGSITEKVLALKPSLTLSILPHAPHSAETARRAEELGFEVMLHMPMENSSEHVIYPGQIMIAMSPEEIHRLTDEALADVPGAVGINNHTGSKFTSDADAMRVFLEGIKDRDLFFVDSRTISTTTAFDVAREMKIPCASRDLFLDHQANRKYIRERFRQLIEICKKQGSAIAICHFRRASVDVLGEMIPRFAKEGITLVHVSELVE